jgi:hypothetical protein
VRCYQYFDISQDWNTASTTCNSNSNGWLVTVHNVEENNYIYDYLHQGSNLYWMGYNDVAVEGTFVWDNGDTSTFTNWCSSEPNNVNGNEDCLVQNHAERICWNDVDCSRLYQIVCETSNTVCPSGSYSLSGSSSW